MLALGACLGCRPGYIRASDLESKGQGPAACAKTCEDLGMRMAALVLVGDTLPGCVCQPVTAQTLSPKGESPSPPSAAPAPAATAPSGAPAPASPTPPGAPASSNGPAAEGVGEGVSEGAAAATTGYVVIAAAVAAQQTQQEQERQSSLPVHY